MSTYTQILYQIVFSTHSREHTLSNNNRNELFKYISSVLRNKKCHLYQIGGVSDHLHIVTHLHPSIALSDLIKDIKLSSSKMIKTTSLFSEFNGWQEGYGAFTYSKDAKENLIRYVQNQEEHHKVKSFEDEYRDLLIEHGIPFEEKYLL